MKRAHFASALSIVLLIPNASHAAEETETDPVIEIEGAYLDVNGQTEIPRGLFGTHAFGLNADNVAELGIECHRQIHYAPGSGCVAIGKEGKIKDLYKNMPVVIDCQGDRYHPASVLTDRNYEARFTEMGRSYAARCRKAGWRGIVEFWNEPYLNWAERSRGSTRNNYHPRFYDVSKAKDNGPVTIKGWEKPLEHFRWRRLWPAYEVKVKDKKTGKEKIVRRIAWSVPLPEGAKPGDTFKGKERWYWTKKVERELTVIEEWHPVDINAIGWWSGPQNRDFYLWMFVPFARAVKAENPDITVIGGWDFDIRAGNWGVWNQLCKPTIAAAIKWMDGITEHHYGLNTRMVPAWYEVACAYAVTRHGKWLKGYNTECGGSLDPAVHGIRDVPADKQAVIKKRAAEATYHLRDILDLAYHCPAKAGSRTAHHPQHHKGTQDAFRFLRDLRGSMLATRSSSLELWPVASVNKDRVVVVLFNDANGDRTVSVNIRAPNGSSLKDGFEWHLEADDTGLKIASTPLKAEGASWKGKVTLGRRQTLKWSFPLQGKPEKVPVVSRKQFFSPDLLTWVAPAKAFQTKISLGDTDLKKVRRAYLKLILEGPNDGEARLELNGQTIRLPNRSWTIMLPIDASWLKKENALKFTCSGKKANGYKVDVASIVTESVNP